MKNRQKPWLEKQTAKNGGHKEHARSIARRCAKHEDYMIARLGKLRPHDPVTPVCAAFPFGSALSGVDPETDRVSSHESPAEANEAGGNAARERE